MLERLPMSDSRTILPAPKMLNLIGVRADANVITISAKIAASTARCPVCGKLSGRVHSRYTRTLADLPWQGVPVTVRMRVRRFFCDQRACDREIFAERLPGIAAHYARRTERLDSWFTHISFALGGEAGSRLLKDLGVLVCGATLLNHIRSMRLGYREAPRVLSVDDFAFRRGTRYGTILVDLEHRRLVDVLPDRSANTFAQWLQEHPGVEVVSRDRGGEYAEAARRVAPHAVQVADRFHLLKNLKDVVSRVFRQHVEVLDLVPPPTNRLQRLTNLRLDREASKERTREQARKLFRSIHALSKKGMKNAQIARTLGIHRHTVEKYLAFNAPPERRHFTKKASALAPYEDYILKRWQQGCRKATQIWQEISEQGYPGAYQNVVRITQYLKEQERLARPVPDCSPSISASHAAGILVKRSENRSEEEIRTLQRLKTVHRITERCCTLFEEFAGMLRDKEQASEEQARRQLEEWTERAKASEIAELKAFAAKLLQDTEAVVAAMVLPYSQGQTEGRVNKLKLIKRSMYGRGNFDLLRQRVLYAAS
jgi:transposase